MTNDAIAVVALILGVIFFLPPVLAWKRHLKWRGMIYLLWGLSFVLAPLWLFAMGAAILDKRDTTD